MAVNDVYRVEVYMNVGSELTMNVHHLRESVSETEPQFATSAIQTFTNSLYLLWAELMSETWKVTTVRVRRVSPTGGIPDTIVYGGAEAIVGQLDSDQIPSTSCALMSLYADSNDRHGRGRQYVPGLAESVQNEGQFIEAPYVANRAALESWYEDEHGPIGAGTGKWKYNIWAAPAAGSDTHDVVLAFLHPNLASQRRRRAFPGFGG